LFYIHSSPSNIAKRDNIRATWGDPSLHAPGTTLLVFIVGQVDDPGVQRALVEEQKAHGDIVQGDFADTYKNLTLKAIFGLKWIATYCKNAEFSLKADDDAFVNVFAWMRVADAKVAADYRRFIMCPLWKANSMPILRDPAKCMKWCVKFTEFPGRQYFPQYCAGLAVLMTREIVAELYRTAVKTPFFWIDDVFLTGIVSAKL
ncbi:Beta-1,3-galactosyltransferase 1, partial [Lamellibrachia satsuma]